MCHWLLVKRYDIDTVERKKMIKAWFVMAGVGNNLQRPTRCMNVYAKYRNEMSKVMSEAQTGQLNSQFGKHWFTNRNTGESKSFIQTPDENWVEGRFLFRGECSKLKIKLPTKEKQTTATRYIKSLTLAKHRWDEFHNGNYTTLTEYAKTLSISKVAIFNEFKKYIPKFTIFKERNKNIHSNKNLIGVYE